MSGKIYRGIEVLLSLPKSFYASWKMTGLKRAFKLPVLCRYNCKLLSVRGKLMGGGKLHIGFNPYIGIFDSRFQRAIINVNGKLELEGDLNMGIGSRLEVGKNATLKTGGLVANSSGLTISCHDRIEIGGNTVISWDTLIMDKDFHYIMDIETGLTRPDHKPIIIGDGVWLCAGSKVLKGAVLPDGSILSAGSVASKVYSDPNTLLVGNPAEVVKRDVKRSDKEVK